MSTEATMTETATTTEGTAASETTDATGTAPEQQGQQQQQETPESTQQTEGTEKPTVPESYELSLPEGLTVDEAVTGKFAELAKECELSQEAAQKLYSEMAPLMAQRQKEQIDAVYAQWKEDAVADKEIGGDKLDENMAFAKKTFDQFGTPELGDFLKASGLANHPELLRWAVRVGKATSEDRMTGATTKPSSNAQRDPAKVLFPNQA